MIEPVTTAVNAGWSTLAGVHPVLPWLGLPAAIWVAIWAFRRLLPNGWEIVTDTLGGPGGTRLGVAWRKLVQSAPSLVLGALVMSFREGTDPGTAALGVLASAGAPLWHETLRWLSSRTPGPTYHGGAFPAAASAPVRRRPGDPTPPAGPASGARGGQ
jgi:hypothetical protein